MPTKKVDVTIRITGLALVFLREEVLGAGPIWNIAFLCDANHTLNLTVNDIQRSDWRAVGPDIFLDVEHSDTATNCDRTRGFGRMLNISSDVYGHGANTADPRWSNLRILNRDTISKTTQLVWMRLPHAELDTDNEDDVKVLRTHPHHGVPKRVADRAKEVILKFKIDADFHLISHHYSSGAELKRETIKISEESHGKINLGLNNACMADRAGCQRNDFVDLYEFVRHVDEDGNQCQFISWAEDAETEVYVAPLTPKASIRHAYLLANGWVSLGTKNGDEEMQRKDFKDQRDENILSPYGNCDPVSSDPPPSGGGGGFDAKRSK